MSVLDRILSLACLAVPLCAGAQARELPDSTAAGRYALVLYAGGGLSWYTAPAGTPNQLETTTQRFGPDACVRLMWLPDHRLRVGFESGWSTVYSYNIEGPGPTGRVQQTAVPLLLMWSMPLTKRFSIFGGWGTYRLTSQLDYLGTARASTYSLGYAAALSYVYPVSATVGVAMEGKWYYVAEARHTLVAAQVQLVWKLYRW